MGELWTLQTEWWNYVLRPLIVYLALLTLFRLLGKKQIGEISPFDLILLLVISESVSNALTGGDNSVLAGIITAASLIAISAIFDRVAFHSGKMEKILEGEPRVIVANGKILEHVRHQEKITHQELQESFRSHGIEDISQIKIAVIESNGKISIVKEEKAVT